MVQAGDDLAALIADGLARAGLQPRDGDVLVLAQKIVSKAEGRSVDLATVTPSARAIAAGGGSAEGPAAGRADPVGIGARRALAARTC